MLSDMPALLPCTLSFIICLQWYPNFQQASASDFLGRHVWHDRSSKSLKPHPNFQNQPKFLEISWRVRTQHSEFVGFAWFCSSFLEEIIESATLKESLIWTPAHRSWKQGNSQLSCSLGIIWDHHMLNGKKWQVFPKPLNFFLEKVSQELINALTIDSAHSFFTPFLTHLRTQTHSNLTHL